MIPVGKKTATFPSGAQELFFLVSVCAVCLFFALRPKSMAIVMAGWSDHLTTLFPGQA